MRKERSIQSLQSSIRRACLIRIRTTSTPSTYEVSNGGGRTAHLFRKMSCTDGQALPDESWTKEETDHLFKLAHEYDLRFIVMADRWDLPSQRGVDVRRSLSLPPSKTVSLTFPPRFSPLFVAYRILKLDTTVHVVRWSSTDQSLQRQSQRKKRRTRWKRVDKTLSQASSSTSVRSLPSSSPFIPPASSLTIHGPSRRPRTRTKDLPQIPPQPNPRSNCRRRIPLHRVPSFGAILQQDGIRTSRTTQNPGRKGRDRCSRWCTDWCWWWCEGS